MPVSLCSYLQLKPGLSAFKDDPKAAAESVRPLLKKALTAVPEFSRPTTPIVVGVSRTLCTRNVYLIIHFE